MTPKKNDTDESDNQLGSLKNQGESLEYSAGTTVSPSTSSKSDNDTDEDSSRTEDSGSMAVAPDPFATGKDKDGVTNAVTPGKTVRAKHFPFKALWERTNVYMLLFILTIFIILAIVAVLFLRSRTNNDKPASSLNSQQLSSETLQELATNGIQVGDPKQVLNIQSNSVFASTVLVKGELQVAGGLKIGSGSLNIPDMNIGGTALINDLQARTLAVSNNVAVQGQLTVQQSLSVNGGGSFNGPITTPQLTTTRLQLSGDLTLTRHIVAGGSIPGRANGGALGTGGTSSNSGSDTAGTISINTGSGAGAGCLVTINFAQAFTSTPHVNVTPVGAAAATLDYYINRTTSNFSVCTANAPPSNSSFSFDYIALD